MNRSALQRALGARGVIIVDAGAGRTLSEVRAAVRHEWRHLHETDLSPEPPREFLADPLAYRAKETLLEGGRYDDDPIEVVREIGAHLRAGQWDELGLNREQARLLWQKYRATQPIDFDTSHIHPGLREDANGQRQDHEGNSPSPQDDGGGEGATPRPESPVEGMGRGGGPRRNPESGFTSPDFFTFGTSRFIESILNSPRDDTSSFGALKDTWVRNFSQLEGLSEKAHGGNSPRRSAKRGQLISELAWRRDVRA